MTENPKYAYMAAEPVEPEVGWWRKCAASVPAVEISKDGARGRHSSSIVREVPFTLYVNGTEIITLMCAGVCLESLSVGFLKSEGLLRDRAGIQSVEIDGEKGFARIQTSEETELAQKLVGKRTITSGCGKGSTFHNSLDALQSRKIEAPVMIRESHIRNLMTELHSRSDLYKETHGVHNCALADAGGIALFRADIGRHNAVDMLTGVCFLHDLPTGDKILLTTGRITSEILIKAAKMGIPAIVSRSSPTSMAVRLAGELNLTIVGRVRAGAMTVYNGIENVLPE